MLQASLAGCKDGELWRRAVTIFVFMIAIIAFGVVAPSFGTLANIRAIELSSSVLLIASIGATFVILMGSIDLSIGAVASFCGMLVARLSPDLGLWSVPIGCLVGLVFGAINGLVYVYLRIPSILVTLGAATTISGAVLFISDGRSLSVSNPAVIEMAQGALATVVPNAVLISAVIYGAAVLVGDRTRFGRMTLAIGSDEQIAALMGVKVNTIKVQAFALSGLLAGLAGVLLAARLGSATVTMETGKLLQASARPVSISQSIRSKALPRPRCSARLRAIARRSGSEERGDQDGESVSRRDDDRR
ncbi:ABC transporter permease, partial [Bradyrhizobium elkanii]